MLPAKPAAIPAGKEMSVGTRGLDRCIIHLR